MSAAAKRPRTGTTVDSLWQEMGLLEDVQELAIRKLIAAELAKAMKRDRLTKAELARKLDTSRPQLDRLLDPLSSGGLTIHTLAKAARVIGKRVEVKLVPA
jgi:predicted XRE-type DNA-binding protein